MKRTIPLGDIVRAKELQVRKIDPEYVDDLAAAYEAKEEIEPLRVWLIKGRPNHWLTRGFHRCAALAKIGRRGAECEIKSGTFEEAFADALSGNHGHGRRMTNKDKREAVKKAIKQFPDWSDRKIAELVGVQHNLVGEVRGLDESSTRAKKDKEKPSILQTAQKAAKKTLAELPTPQTADDWLAELVKHATAIAEAVKQSNRKLF